jgi:hypothetical protein
VQFLVEVDLVGVAATAERRRAAWIREMAGAYAATED